MANHVTFEVYTLAGGRWILDSRFKKEERERAIDEGRQLAKQQGIEAVKVVRETFDENDNLIKESTVYNSQAKPVGAGREEGGGDFIYKVDGFEDLEAGRIRKESGTYDSGPADGAGTASSKAKRRRDAVAAPPAPRNPAFGLVYKLLIVGGVSFVFAAFTTWIYLMRFA